MKARVWGEKNKKILAAAGIALFLTAVLVGTWLLWEPIQTLAKEPERFRSWIDNHSFLGQIAYCGIVILQVIVAVIPGEPVEIFAGYAFGFWKGTILCLGGAVAGSLLVFLLVRLFGRKLVTVFFSEDKLKTLRFLQTDHRRSVLFFFVFLLPGTPKDLLCYFAGLTDMPWTVWLWICSVGRIPALVTSVMGGNALGGKNYLFAVIVFAGTFLVSGAGLLLYHYICEKMEKGRKEQQDL